VSSSGIRDQFPFGDLDEGVTGAVGRRVPGVSVPEITAALDLGKSALMLLERLPAPIEAAGLSPARWRLLIALMFQEGDRGGTITEIARHLGVREPTATATVNRAEEAGHVARRRDDTDRRVVRVTVTEEGSALVAELLPVVAGRLMSFVARLGGADEVRSIASRLAEAIDAVDFVAAEPANDQEA
jgi:DNA-binding MarR family transcriptional regulator